MGDQGCGRQSNEREGVLGGGGGGAYRFLPLIVEDSRLSTSSVKKKRFYTELNWTGPHQTFAAELN